ncbi:superoxide dismutase [Rickettsiales endosymbiont of Trichoplax sp. H2]|uniref:superoxide dismutase n=1 Tax=Rickettsiales endosymbiont of Trichoplax sp. H2 TaxID=2021221 RepID=UPI0012B36D59|nr:superoxide dismutase [Rickettsiales endosymbiont of Trichoplax sp. H2]MSO13950.1 Superoxide dismutase [Fe] [Rickettsiales endosymbiont of Trichoplax sp. H2]
MIKLKSLPYSKNTLQPTITKETIDFHYDKHHKGYVDKLNKFIEGTPYESLSLEDIIKKSYISKDTKIFNNAAQIWNHDFYWDSIRKKIIIDDLHVNELDKNKQSEKLDKDILLQNKSPKENPPPGDLLNKINEDFNSFEEFYKKFVEAGVTLFGSGWIWLVQNPNTKKLEIMQTYNADSPMLHNKIAILTIDVWEHAYYIDYKNDRLSYLENVIKFHLNWDFAKNNIKL